MTKCFSLFFAFLGIFAAQFSYGGSDSEIRRQDCTFQYSAKSKDSELNKFSEVEIVDVLIKLEGPDQSDKSYNSYIVFGEASQAINKYSSWSEGEDTVDPQQRRDIAKAPNAFDYFAYVNEPTNGSAPKYVALVSAVKNQVNFFHRQYVIAGYKLNSDDTQSFGFYGLAICRVISK